MGKTDFNFAGVEANTYGIQGDFHVPILPARRKNTIAVPGMDGEYDFGNNAYEPIAIQGDCWIKAASRAARDTALSSAAVWLSKSGPLILGRDTTKRFPAAKVYNLTEIEKYLGKAATFPLAFECSSPYLEDVNATTVTSFVAGTDYGSPLPFCPVITITKTGTAATSLQVAIASSGRCMLITDDIPAGTVLVFDMSTGKATKNAASCMTKLGIGCLPFCIPPGAQTITVTTQSTYTVSMSYRKRYLYA